MASAINNQLNSAKFNARQEFIHMLQKHDLNELIAESNSLHNETKQIDGDLQTLVYANYTKFMGATDLTRNINASLSSAEITADLEDLKGNLQSINRHHKVIDGGLKLKLKQIKKLDILQKDLDKLKYLSELPDMFKEALDTYQRVKSTNGVQLSLQNPSSGAPSVSDDNQGSSSVDISEIFGKTLQLY